MQYGSGFGQSMANGVSNSMNMGNQLLAMQKMKALMPQAGMAGQAQQTQAYNPNILQRLIGALGGGLIGGADSQGTFKQGMKMGWNNPNQAFQYGISEANQLGGPVANFANFLGKTKGY